MSNEGQTPIQYNMRKYEMMDMTTLMRLVSNSRLITVRSQQTRLGYMEVLLE